MFNNTYIAINKPVGKLYNPIVAVNNELMAKPKNADCKIFFLPYSAIDNKEIIELIRANCQKIKTVLQPIVIVSFTDKIDENVRNNPLQNQQYDLIERVSEILEIDQRYIFTPVNYVSESLKSFEIDRANYKIFLKTLRIVGSNFRHLLKYGTIKFE